MIYKITYTAILLLLVSIAYAQDDETDNREKLQFGARVGISNSNVYDSEGEEFDTDAKFGLTGGAFIMIPIGKYLGVQPEVLITQKGFQGSGRLLGSNYDLKRTTTFFEIPVLVAFKPSEFITVLLGPQYSYLLKQKDEFTSSLTSYSQEREFEQDDVRKNILGIVGGLDINLRHVVIGARAGWDIQKNKGDGTSNTPRYKNVCLKFVVGYKLYKS